MNLRKIKEHNIKVGIISGYKENKSQLEIGMNEVKKHDMMHRMAGLRDSLTLLQSEFEKEYGTFDVNIQDGTINYPKENGEADKKD